MRRNILLICTLLCVLVSCRATDSAQETCSDQTVQTQSCRPQSLSGRELFYSDSLNAFSRSRVYPVPDCSYTPAPKGYKPVYISSYARHGSRKPIGTRTTEVPIKGLEAADSAGCLTPLGKEVLGKLRIIDDNVKNSLGDLTEAGVEQHKGIADRMYRNYPNVFSRKGTPVRLYSTLVQRTMLSMFACNEALLKNNHKINSTRQASNSLSYLVGGYKNDRDIGTGFSRNFIADYFDYRPLFDKLFVGDAPALKDTIGFVENIYDCGTYVMGLGLPEADYVWDLFTLDELFTLQQAINLHMYIYWCNSPQLGDLVLPAIKPLLKDFMDKADAALAEDVPGADLRFGHDIHLMQLLALIGVNGYVEQVEDRQKVIDQFQDFIDAPMAANLQMVFYRNRAGDVLVKFLQNEVESWIPIDTDVYPYYHWNEVREYFITLLED